VSQSLWKIESEIGDLLEIRQELLDDRSAVSALMATENRLAELFGAEVAKVDGVRSVWAHLEMVADAAGDEAKRQQDRRRQALAQLDRLKTGVQAVMESMPWREGKPRKIEGQAGALYLKANGGKQAVEVTDDALVPDEFKTVTLTMSAAQYERLWEYMGLVDAVPSAKSVAVSLSAIAAELEKPCAACKGKCEEADALHWVMCSQCGGTGKRGVPGARLAPRGQHV